MVQKPMNPLDTMIKEVPVFMGKYALDNKLTNEPGLKRLKRFTKNQKLSRHLLSQAKRASHRSNNKPIYKFVITTPYISQ